MDGQYWKGDRTMSTNKWLLTSDFWQFLEPWHGRWYENEICIASCTDNIYDLENERWLLGDMIDHVGIYGSGVAEGLSAFSVGLVYYRISPEVDCRQWQESAYFRCHIQKTGSCIPLSKQRSWGSLSSHAAKYLLMFLSNWLLIKTTPLEKNYGNGNFKGHAYTHCVG